MKAYSMDLRERVLEDSKTMSTRDVASKYRVSPAWVRRLKQRFRETGKIGPKEQRRGPVPAWVTHAERIRDAVHQAPDATLDELRERMGLPLPRSTLARALIVLGQTRKKSRSAPANRTVRTSRRNETLGRPSKRLAPRRWSRVG
jgi:transposase